MPGSGQLWHLVASGYARRSSWCVSPRNNLRAVAGGETMIVPRNGSPPAELRPLCRRTFVPRAELALAAVRAPVVDSGALRAEVGDVLDRTPLGDCDG